MGKTAIKNIKNWVSQGGVLITLGTVTRFASDIEVGLLTVKRELAFKEKNKDKPCHEADKKNKKSTIASQLLTSKKELLSAIKNQDNTPDHALGVLVNLEVDQEHWLTAGVHKNAVEVVTGQDIYNPIKLASGKNVVWFAEKDKLLVSGYLWDNRVQLAYKPYLIHQPLGSGMVISFTQESTCRAYLDGSNLMFLNSIFRAAAHSNRLN